MADHTRLNEGAGGDLYYAEQISDVVTGTTPMVQGVKVLVGGRNANDGPVSTANPMPVTVISGGGAGTQYTEADTDASITGTAVLMEGAGDALVPLQGDAANGLLVNLGSNNDVTVAGVSTAARQDTGNTSLATIAGAVSGTEMQVDVLVLPALPAGDNAIGRVKLTDGTDVADILDLSNSNPLTVAIVDGSGDQITSFGGGTQYTEDAAAAANPVGTAPILVRADTPAGVTSTDGDNIAQRGTDYGAAYVQVVTSGGAFVDTFGGGTQYTEGDTDATITGTAMLAEGAGDALATLKVGAGTEAAALRVTIATDSTGVVSVDDNGSTLSIDDGGGAITVDGTVAVTDGGGAITVDNAGTFAVQVDGNALTALQLIDNPVSVLGTATYTETTSSGMLIGAVRRDADTSAVGTDNEIAPLLVDANGYLKVEIFDGGGSHTVDGTVTANLAAGTNNIGDVDILSIAAGDNNIGNVDIVTVPAPLSTTGGGTEAAALRVTLASDSTGLVSVDDNGGALTVDNGGTFAVQVDGNALTALQLIDDPVMTLGTTTYTETTTKGTLAAAIRRDADTSAVNTDNEAAPLLVNAIGALKVEVFDGGDSHTIDNAALSVTGGGVEATALRVTLASDSTGVLSVDDNGGTLTVDNAALSVVGGGVEASALRVTIANDSTGVVSVDDNGASLTVDYATTGSGTATGALRVELANNGTGVLATVGAVTTVSTVTTVATLTGGGIAHDGIDSGNPHKIGAKAETSPKGITLVSDADRTDLLADADGMLMVKLNTSGADLVSERVTNTDGASTAFTNFSAVASTRNYVTAYSMFRTDAGTTPIYVDIRDGTAGAILWSVVLPPNGGANLASAMPLFKSSANTALAYDVSAATTTVYISMSGYQSKVG